MNQNLVRTSLLFIFSLIIFSYLFFVLYRLQISRHSEYYNIRESQNKYVNMESKRGTIFGTKKNGDLYPLAEDETWYKLVVSPKDIPTSYEDRLYFLLNQITPIDKQVFLDKLKNKQDIYEEVKILNADEAEKVEELGIQGVQTYKTYKRIYSMDGIGGRIIGFVGGGDDGYVGRYGLEKYYNNDLVGKVNVNSTFISKVFNPKVDDDNSLSSKNIVTSIEPNVMQFINKTLQEMKQSWDADELSAIVIDAKTGNIVAMETIPEFDPNNYQNFDIKDFINPSVQGVYELGSIMKPITLSGALEKGLITPQTVYHDYGFVKIDNYTIKNFDEKVRGDQTMQDVISKSLNTGAVYVQKLMGKDLFKSNFKNFGLTDQTNVDFPGEIPNLTDNLDTDSDVNYATAAFGQGVAITPLGMLSSLDVIANNGKNICPHFLIEKNLDDGTTIPYICENDIKQIVSTTTANTMKDMMVELIDNGLAHGRYKDLNYKVAAKTGTAQLPSPDGKYYKDKFIHSYFTFFPADNPKFAVLIYQVNPKKGSLASLTLAPFASKIKDFLLTYYNIPPDRK